MEKGKKKSTIISLSNSSNYKLQINIINVLRKKKEKYLKNTRPCSLKATKRLASRRVALLATKYFGKKFIELICNQQFISVKEIDIQLRKSGFRLRK